MLHFLLQSYFKPSDLITIQDLRQLPVTSFIYLDSGGGKIPLSTDWFWINTALLRYVAYAPWSVVTNTGLAYKSNELTFGYQWDASFAGTLLIQANDFLSFGYSYQFQSSNTLASLSNGNHELLIKIRIGKSAAEETQEEPSGEPEAAIETSAKN